MKNRAKCKLCGDIIESFHSSDLVRCKCGEIEVDGGDAMRCSAWTSFDNFLRVDEMGNKIPVKYVDVEKEKDSNSAPDENPKPLTKSDLIEEVERMIEADENVLKNFADHGASLYDILRYMLRLINILKR